MIEQEKVEDQIYAEQYEWVKKRFGKRAADSANYGWGVTEGESSVTVATKVYGKGVLTSVGTAPDRINHNFRKF